MCLDQHVNWFHGCLAPFVTSKWLVCRLFTLRTKAFNCKHLIVLTSRLRGYWILIKSMRFWVRNLLLFILGSSGVWDGGLHTFKGIIRYSRRSRYPCLLKKKKKPNCFNIFDSTLCNFLFEIYWGTSLWCFVKSLGIEEVKQSWFCLFLEKYE